MSLNYTNQYIQSILSYLDYVTFISTDDTKNMINKNLQLTNENDNNDVDSLGEGQSASTFIKKNE